jgi:hypothetical protein
MNNITKRNRLMDLLDRYGAFLKSCDSIREHKMLLAEMSRMVEEMDDIKSMNRTDLHRQVKTQIEVFSSRMNNPDFDKELDDMSVIQIYGKSA